MLKYNILFSIMNLIFGLKPAELKRWFGVPSRLGVSVTPNHTCCGVRAYPEDLDRRVPPNTWGFIPCPHKLRFFD